MNKQQLILTLHYGNYEYSYEEVIPILYSSIEELKKDLRLKIIEQIESQIVNQSKDQLISINESKKEGQQSNPGNHNKQENPILEFIPQLSSYLYNDYLFSKNSEETIKHCSDYQIANNIYKSSEEQYYFIEELDIQTLEEWLLNNNIEPSL